ncbi:MAG: ATP synthase F1 subunit delta [Rickettsiales bacterium]|nr:ATP synthase F1 subunit delta [Rickettsiales bacterium]
MSKKILTNNLIAKKYATAIFKLADKEKKHDSILKDFKEIFALLQENEKLNKIIKNPYLNDKTKKQAVKIIAKNLNISDEVNNFLALLISKKRLNHISNIISEYQLIWQKNNNEQSCKIISANKLTTKEITEINEVLTNKFAKKIICTNIIDQEILGGVKIIIGSKMIDCSLANKIKLFEINSKNTLLA